MDNWYNNDKLPAGRAVYSCSAVNSALLFAESLKYALVVVDSRCLAAFVLYCMLAAPQAREQKIYWQFITCSLAPR